MGFNLSIYLYIYIYIYKYISSSKVFNRILFKILNNKSILKNLIIFIFIFNIYFLSV